MPPLVKPLLSALRMHSFSLFYRPWWEAAWLGSSQHWVAGATQRGGPWSGGYLWVWSLNKWRLGKTNDRVNILVFFLRSHCEGFNASRVHHLLHQCKSYISEHTVRWWYLDQFCKTCSRVVLAALTLSLETWTDKCLWVDWTAMMTVPFGDLFIDWNLLILIMFEENSLKERKHLLALYIGVVFIDHCAAFVLNELAL